ncbi:MAG: SIMPL domain-containing protein [Patescibacteria group bacterium]
MKNSKFIFILISGLLLIAGFLIFGLFLQAIHSRAESYDLLLVSGSAKARIISNNAELKIFISRLAPLDDLTNAYGYFEYDLDWLKKTLKENGLDISRLEISPVIIEGKKEEDASREAINIRLTRTVTINGETDKITKVSQAVSSFNSAAVTFSVQSLEYYNSDYPDLYEPLLKEAFQDAKAQAYQKAADLGRHLGEFKRVVSGSERILPADSPDIFYDRYYDTSSIEKDMVIKVVLLFGFK